MASVSGLAAFFLLPSLCTVALTSNPVHDQASVIGQVTITPRAKRGPVPDPTDVYSARLRVDVPLVLVPVHVDTALGGSVTNLIKEDFQLFEDNVEQTITHFSKEDGPVSVGLVFDASSSMRDKMRKSAGAVTEFLRTLNPEDEFFLIEFNESPRLALAFTQDSAEVQKRILHTKPLGRTSLLDAIQLALSQMKKARNFRKAICAFAPRIGKRTDNRRECIPCVRRGIVILSDGGDNRRQCVMSR
jgi:VWFA-related protein